MHRADKALDEFMEIYREAFGEEISRSEASEMAFRLVALYEVLAKRLPYETGVTPLAAEPSQQSVDFQACESA